MSDVKNYECKIAEQLIKLIDEGHTKSSVVRVYTLLDDLIKYIELDNRERMFKTLLKDVITEALDERRA